MGITHLKRFGIRCENLSKYYILTLGQGIKMEYLVNKNTYL